MARRHLVTWSQTLWVLTLKSIWSSFRLDATVTEKGAKDANSATAAESAESAENVIGTAVRPAVRLSVATVRILLNLEVHSPPSHVSHAVAARSQHRSGRAHSEGLTSLPAIRPPVYHPTPHDALQATSIPKVNPISPPLDLLDLVDLMEAHLLWVAMFHHHPSVHTLLAEVE